MLLIMKDSKILWIIVSLMSILLLFSTPVLAISAEFTKGCAGGNAVNTALGCIPVNDMTETLKFFLRLALGISGGATLLMFIATSYSILTSSGDPQKLQAAKENIVSIFTGLLLVAFSLVLLQTIGADILGLPTF